MLIYVNNVERGQAEIYVVLEEAQIGVRIRESHNLDIDRLPMYQESMGMLDISLSVPPQYGVVSTYFFKLGFFSRFLAFVFHYGLQFKFLP